MADDSDGNGNEIIGQMNKTRNEQNNLFNDDDTDKVHQFEVQLTRLETAKDELVKGLRTERINMITDHQNQITRFKRDMNLMEKNLNEQIDRINAEKRQIEHNHIEEIEKMKREIKNIETELQKTRSSAEKTKIDFENIIKLKEKDITQLCMDKDQMEDDLKKDIDAHKKEAQQLNHELKDMTKERDTHLKHINELNAKLTQIGDENTFVKNDLIKEREKSHDLQTIIDDLHDEIDELRTKLDTEITENTHTIGHLNEELSHFKSEYENAKRKIESLERSLKELEDIRETLMGDYEQLKNNMKETEKSRFEIKRELNNSQMNCASFENDIKLKDTKMKEMQMTFNKRLEEIQSELKTVKLKLIESETNKEHLDQELKAVKQYANDIEQLLKVEKDKCHSLKIENDTLISEITLLRHELQMETNEKLEKVLKLKSLNDELNESHSEIEELRKNCDDLNKSRQESEDEKSSLTRDCGELRNTLKEVEKSRLEIRKELNNSRIKCSTIESELKSKENEIRELQLLNTKRDHERHLELNAIKSKLCECESAKEALRQEVNGVKHHANELEQLLKLEKNNLVRSETEMKRLYNNVISLESTRQSVIQLKELNSQLTHQNKQLQAQVSLCETERRETERKYNSSAQSSGDKDTELLLYKSEIMSLKEKIMKVESEKKRLERCYSQMEKEKSSLKHTLDEIQHKSNHQSFVNSSKNKDPLIDEAKIISQGLAALEQKNIELQKKVTDLQSLMSVADYSTNVTQTNGNVLPHSKKDTSEHLKSAQKQAQRLLRDKSHKSMSTSNIEKELSLLKDQLLLSPSLSSTPSRFKESPKRASASSATATSTPLPLYSPSSGLTHVKRKLDYK